VTVADVTLAEAGWGDVQAAPPTLSQCLAGVVYGPLPSACAPLVSCLEADVDASSPGCGADLVACFGADYASGTVWGECQSFTSCAMQSSCTAAAGESCIGQTSSTCEQCILEQFLPCARKRCLSPLEACDGGLLSGLSDAGAGDSSAADTAAVDSHAPDSQAADSGTAETSVPEGSTDSSALDGSTEGG